ncbi:MAG: alpha/beta hydrolase family protein [Jatrophihabitans sp.]
MTALLAVAALTTTGVSEPAAYAWAATEVGSGSQPPPGFTIDNPPLPPLATTGGFTTVLQGIHDHAGYAIEVPPHWNGQLVLWAHPFNGTGSVLSFDPPEFGLRQLFVDQGYAWAASSFTDNGFDVGSGVRSTHELAVFAAQLLHRQPSRRYLVGISMGGQVVARSLEQYPRYYSGAMPMCGSLGDDRLFDYIADTNLVAQDLAGIRAYPIPADYQSEILPAIENALGIADLSPGQQPTNALGRQFEASTVRQSGGNRPGAQAAFSYWVSNGLFQLTAPDDGGSLADNYLRVAQNLFTRYSPNTPLDLNRTVQRIAPADLIARLDPGLSALPHVVGDPQVPVLTLHGLGDLAVPLSMEQDYARRVAAHGETNLLVQRVIREASHCEYSPVETATAWDDLVRWVRSAAHAARPAGDSLLDPRVLASPGYGCRFTDQSAYADPTDFPTRSLYPRCPA